MPKPPKPFSRPSISLGSDKKREWQHVPVEELVEGDVIADFGELEGKEWHGEDVIITSSFLRVERLPKGTKVHAYVYSPEAS